MTQDIALRVNKHMDAKIAKSDAKIATAFATMESRWLIMAKETQELKELIKGGTTGFFS